MRYLTILNNSFTKQNIRRCFLFAFIPACIFYLMALGIMLTNGFEVMEVLRDPAQLNKNSSFLGFLSNIGVWLWVSSVAISYFTLLQSQSKFRDNTLLFSVGTLSLVLAIDDFFMIHDRFIEQNLCYITYALVDIAILVKHFDKVMRINGFCYVLASALLALSIGTDLIQRSIPYPVVQIFEEGFKFTGAAVWLYFIFQTASNRLNANNAHH